VVLVPQKQAADRHAPRTLANASVTLTLVALSLASLVLPSVVRPASNGGEAKGIGNRSFRTGEGSRKGLGADWERTCIFLFPDDFSKEEEFFSGGAE
jgi:hypothetical protein